MYNTQILNHKSRNHMKVSSTVKAIYYAVSFALFIGCSSNEIEESSTPIVTIPTPVVQAPQGCPSGRVANANPTGDFTTLVWADEFNEDGAPCENNWFHEIIPPDNGGWYNNEQQFYTDSRSNSIVEDGVLKITAIKEQFEGKKYTSARMTTQRLFEFLYGKIEIRAKLPQGQGTWPALWFLGANIDSVGWGSPFLLVPEATTVDEPTMKLLSDSQEKDLYLSDISPLGVPFNSLKGNTKDIEKLASILKGKPGSACPKEFLVSNNEYTNKPLCTASRRYQRLKIKELKQLQLHLMTNKKKLMIQKEIKF